MKNIAIMQRSDNKIDSSSVFPFLDRLISCGCSVYIPEELSDFYSSYGKPVHYCKNGFDKNVIDILFVFGGDGSIISAARENAHYGFPIVGVNFGNLAYMAELEITELDLAEKILCGEYSVEERIMLDVSVIRGDRVLSMKYPSLNDAVLSNGPIPKLISFDLSVNGITAQSYCSDGMVVATPTGSTAYSMSAGGPVLDPHLESIVATPICPHSIGQRPVVFGSDAVIELKNFNCRKNNIYLSADGSEVLSIEPGDIIRISRSEYVTKLIHVKNSPFIKILNEKMGEKRTHMR